HTDTPERRQALESIFGAEMFRDADTDSTSQTPKASPAAVQPTQTSGIESLPPITAQLHDELLSALSMTDKLDTLFKGGCNSAEFIRAALPVEGVVMKLQGKLPLGDPRRDLLANSFEAYQQSALAMQANERGNGERPYATIVTAQIRKHLLRGILEGNMTPEDKKFYYAWRKALESGQ